jgi:hypothetical protein
MKTTEIRVRPVVRHVVTRFTSEHDEHTRFAGFAGGGCETLGEFDSEQYADVVADALRMASAARVYVIVQETLGEEIAIVHYAGSEEEAASRKTSLEERTGKSFRIYSRVREPLLG